MGKKTHVRKPKVLATKVEFIEPLNCGSTVGYKIIDDDYEDHSYFSSSIQLTDCSRMISWDVSVDSNGVAKLDNAIRILTEAREELSKAAAKLAKLKKKEK